MVLKKVFALLEEHLATKNCKHSDQRRNIIEVMASVKKHWTIAELAREVQKKFPTIGQATVYRTIRLLCDGDLCREIRLEDGTARYELLSDKAHHDHLICVKCGMIVEVVDDGIEALQEKIYRANGFEPHDHRMELFGVCRKCRKGSK